MPEVCKHEVCDHCDGRFGMVTHRWWGNKFCKRTCKNAYLCENHHTLSGWVIPRFFTFASGACLAAAVAVAVLTLLLASANAAPDESAVAAFRRAPVFLNFAGVLVVGPLLHCGQFFMRGLAAQIVCRVGHHADVDGVLVVSAEEFSSTMGQPRSPHRGPLVAPVPR
jgi:hypothetical protein